MNMVNDCGGDGQCSPNTHVRLGPHNCVLANGTLPFSLSLPRGTWRPLATRQMSSPPESDGDVTQNKLLLVVLLRF